MTLSPKQGPSQDPGGWEVSAHCPSAARVIFRGNSSHPLSYLVVQALCCSWDERKTQLRYPGFPLFPWTPVVVHSCPPHPTPECC